MNVPSCLHYVNPTTFFLWRKKRGQTASEVLFSLHAAGGFLCHVCVCMEKIRKESGEEVRCGNSSRKGGEKEILMDAGKKERRERKWRECQTNY